MTEGQRNIIRGRQLNGVSRAFLNRLIEEAVYSDGYLERCESRISNYKEGNTIEELETAIYILNKSITIRVKKILEKHCL